jgi:hypothetical protein
MNLLNRAQRTPAASPAGPVNRRRAERKRQRLIDGFLIAKGMPKRPCTVCDMSATGSRVEVWSDASRPLLPGDRVTLYIPGDRKEIDAEVRWRKANAMGMRFTSTFRSATRP